MKPIALQLENFGPYQQETIDFQHFYDTPLFLISGKTGSGKTTIFDGMTFALFGETTGGIRQGKEMRSNFASLEEPTSVRFSFSHQGLKYEINREPEQEVAKRVGEGTTIRPAKVSLTVFNEKDEELQQLTKTGEVRTFLEELLHLNAHQFTQIVLLPQGDFRKFLNADSNEKEVVLRKLFKTTIYRQLAERIKEKRKEYQAELAQSQREIDLLLEQVDWLEEFAEEQGELTGVEERLALLEKEIAYALADQAKQREHLQGQRRLVEVNETTLQSKQRLVELFQEQSQLEIELKKLALRATEIATDQARLDELNWLAKQESALRRFGETGTELQRLKDLATKNKQELKKIQVALEETTQQSQKLTDEEAKMNEKQQEVTSLTQLEPLLKEKLAQVEQQKVASMTLAEVKREVSQTELALLEIEEKNQQYVAELKLLPEKQTKQVQLKGDIQQVVQWQEHSQSAASYAKELSLTERQAQEQAELLTEQTAVVTAAETDVKQLKSESARLQIARLSMDLIPGEPCLVCGSTEHPAPHLGQSFSPGEIKQAEEKLEAAELALTKAQKTLVKSEEEARYLLATAEKIKKQLIQEEKWLDNRLAQGTEDTEIKKALNKGEWSELTQLLVQEETNLVAMKKNLTAEMALAEQHQRMLAASEKEKLGLTEKQEELKLRESQAQSNLLKIEATLAQLSQQVPPEWTTVEALINQRASLTQELVSWQEDKEKTQQQLTTLNNQLLVCQTNQELYQGEQKVAKLRLVELTTTLETAIVEADQKGSPQDLLERLGELAEIPVLAKALEAFKVEQQQTQLQLKQVSEKIGEQTLPDLTPLIAEIENLKNANHELERTLIQSEQQGETNAKLHKQVKNNHDRLGSELQALGELNQLSEVANGDGPYNKKSLERYVLQAYFEEILRVANSRLVQLTGNRYSFELKEEQGSYKSQTGLEINIYDDNVGAVRSVNTLSGGESFIAALALSLSLAEVVQNQAGGVQIEAMFIDEGFGALDEEALEMALNALELIEGKGRMIGIISHVSELKQRIPQQLRVIAGGSGTSHIRYQTEQE